jgi:7tm Odorant receptor
MMCLPQVLYILRSDDEFFDVVLGICELIQSIVYNVKMVSVLVSRQDLKALVECIARAFEACKQESQALRDFHDQTVRRSFVIVLVYLLLVPGALLVYFYVPITIDLVKFLMGRDDLSYPMLKADYFFFDPKASGLVFVVYTIISKIYINYFLMEFYIMDLFLVTLFFYVGSYMEAVKLKFRLLSEATDLTEAETVKQLKSIIDDHATAVWMVKTLDSIIRNMMLAQFLLFSLSFCFVLFNLTQVSLEFYLLFVKLVT